MRHNDTIRQGATFYREVTASSTTLTVEQMRAMTPRATLLDTSIVMPCTWIGDGTAANLAWTLSRDITAMMDETRTYEYNLDIYSATDTHEVLNGIISVRKGQKP